MPYKTYTEEEIKKMKDLTDQERLERMTDEEIERNARNDPDSALPDDEQLRRFRKVKQDEPKQ